MPLTHDDLIAIGRRWLLKPWHNAAREGHPACSLVLTDMTSSGRETPDVIGWSPFCSVLIECKTSVNDFKADANKSFRCVPNQGVGTRRYYMAPKGLIAVDKLPEGWGLIEVHEGKTRVKRASSAFDANLQAETAMLLSLIRRLKVDPGKHVAIRAYTIDRASKEPRATVTLVQETKDE